MDRKALVLFSGGQDSTTCLYWAKEKFDEVYALTIDYGQRHQREIESSKKICELANVKQKIVPISFLKNMNDSALLDGSTDDVNKKAKHDEKLPASFVPGRNVLMLTLIAIYGYSIDIHDIVTGVCQTDYSGYPDCRDNTIKATQLALSLGLGKDIIIHTPLMFLTKAEEVKLAQELNGCMQALAYSHTCYNGEFPPCGECPSCKLRQKGFDEAGVLDPIYTLF